MLTSSEINAFVENGYIIRKGALSQTDIQTYRSAIDRILHKCRIERLHAEHLRYIDGERDDNWGVNNIFHPSIREQALVDALAHPQILDVIEALIGERLKYIQRYKGLGEMNPDQLWETTMDPETRKMLVVNIEDTVEVDNVFHHPDGELVAPRRSFIAARARSVTNLDV